MLTLDELKKKHDKAYNHNSVPREQGSDDLVFYWVTQWDDNLLQDSQLSYRGEFNIIRKGGRQIIGDLRSNPIQVDFDPKDSSREDGAELLDGLYRSDDRRNTSIEAYDYASQDAVVCGYGAWELYTEYESSNIGDTKQVIKRRFIPEANNTAFWDPNAKSLDKSDAMYWSVLTSYSEEGYKDLVEELTGERPDNLDQSFKMPEQSYSFPWYGDSKKIYVTSFYHKAKIKDKILVLEDPVGQSITLRESDLAEVMDDLLNEGYTIVDEKEIERWEVRKYVASGAEILNGEMNDETGEREGEVIAGQCLPVVPMFGERAFIEGVEYWEGVTRLAKDPQRLRNFQLSYLADIASRSPRPKPIFNPEQIQGFEDMYAETGADNNYPYLLANRNTANGEPLAGGPVGMMPEQPIPTALAAGIELSRQAVEDVVNPGIPQDIADPDLSGKAVIALQNRMDQQSIVYQQNLKFAKRYDGEVYASMASEVYSVPREVTVTMPDGTRSKKQIMSSTIDQETGELVMLNDISNMEFDVYSDISPTYSSQKDATIDQIGQMVANLPPGDPMRGILQMKQIALMDGVDTDDVRAHANKQLLLQGVKTPETPEEEEMLAQASQANQEPSAEMVLAQAEMLKGQAAMAREQREGFSAQAKAENDQAGTQVDVFKAQTDRMNTQIDAEKAGADINYKNIDAFGKQLDNAGKTMKLRNPLMSRISG